MAPRTSARGACFLPSRAMIEAARQETLSVVVPAYNEGKTITQILDRVAALRLGLHIELIVVDDGSKDDTADVVRAWAQKAHEGLTVRVISKPNGGKGSAVRKGIEVSTGDYVIIQDADLEYDPEDYARLLEPMLAGEADVVYGSRVHGPDKRGQAKFFYGGRLVTAVTNLLYGSHLSDEPTCYKLFRGPLLRSIPLTCTGFEFCPEVTAKVLRAGKRIAEVPIRYHPRSIEEGKKIRAMDGFWALWELLKWRLL
ncbi:MAG: Dodecaprenyl-phosphate galacturonate synthase [Planctomycetes bacterium]|nr:Dodecaprenyl-phosphate galacturonate synthase [Planctomycetota bacterium]